MNAKLNKFIIGMILAVFAINFISAIAVNADYVTLFPGEEGKVTVGIENNENFDIESVSMALNLDNIPFASIGSSEKDFDDIDEDDKDSVSFTLRPSTDIKPGDYNIPYLVKFTNVENSSETFEKEGSFGIRVSAKTEIDFSVEVRDSAIVGREGKVSLEIINRGLGEIKSVSVLILPNGFELLSKDKIFIGTIDADDTDLATFDVIYRTTNPTLSARVEYKDFDNNDHVETVNIPFEAYTEKKALELGIITKSNTWTYVIGAGIIVLAWLIWRAIKKRRKNRKTQ